MIIELMLWSTLLATICLILCFLAKHILLLRAATNRLEIDFVNKLSSIEARCYHLQETHKQLFDIDCDVMNSVLKIDSTLDATVNSNIWRYGVEKALEQFMKKDRENKLTDIEMNRLAAEMDAAIKGAMNDN